MKRILTIFSFVLAFAAFQDVQAQCGVSVYDSLQICNSSCNASLYASPDSGQSPYTYVWSNGDSTGYTGNLCAGTYTVTMTDNNGCTSTATHTFVNSVGLTASITSNNGSCGCTGWAISSGTGGIPPYTYWWSNGNSGDSIGGLCSGTYTVTIYDANYCSDTASVVISNSTNLSVSTATVSETCFGCCDGSITATPSGGTAPYTYSWMPGGATTATVNSLCQGLYSLTITDANGCTVTQQDSVFGPPAPTCSISITSDDALCNGACNGAAVAIGTATSYLWSNGATTQVIGGLCPGTYTVTSTDGNGCTATASTVIGQPSAMVVNVNAYPETCQGCCNGGATAFPSGGTPPYSYSWMPGGSTSQTLNNLCGNTEFGLTTTDANGCMTVDSVFIDSSSNWILSGCINIGGTTADDSRAYLIKATPSGGSTLLSAVDSLDLDSIGCYLFNLTSAGTYYVKGALRPTSTQFSNYLPTYYGDEAQWANATGIVVTTTSSLNNDINLISGLNPGGPGFIGGLVSQGANKKHGPGDPLENIQVLLLDNDGNVIAERYTNANGEYEFADIELANYKLYVEILNKTSATFPITLSQENQSFETADFQVYETFIDAITSVEEINPVAVRGMFPNPAKDFVTLELEIQSAAAVQLEIINAVGQVVRSENMNLAPGFQQTQLNIADFPAGLYLIKLAGADFATQESLIIE